LTTETILYGERNDSHPGIAFAREWAQREDIDPPHVFQVARLALALFDATRYLHKLGPNERRLLEAAALLHDLGHNRDPITHHKHSRDMILEAELPEFSGRERSIIACVARYHRKGHPKPKHRVYADLRHKDKVIVSRLAAVLRIADGCDRSHTANAESLEVSHHGKEVTILLRQRQENTADLWGANRKRELFEQLYEVTVGVVAKAKA
jgi:exopolyphosphatase/guanosine-5'-triphosphate,3'-diphosphate pyrophosphatase